MLWEGERRSHVKSVFEKQISRVGIMVHSVAATVVDRVAEVQNLVFDGGKPSLELERVDEDTLLGVRLEDLDLHLGHGSVAQFNALGKGDLEAELVAAEQNHQFLQLFSLRIQLQHLLVQELFLDLVLALDTLRRPQRL